MTHDISNWKWYGCAGHFIASSQCRFHLFTEVGPWIVSTVGEYLPAEGTREILAKCRGIELSGEGDARELDYLTKLGFEQIGCDRKYETMVFRTTRRCTSPECSCDCPMHDGHCIYMDGYNDAGAATLGHLAMCMKYSEIDDGV